MQAASPTEVPPNFITCSLGFIPGRSLKMKKDLQVCPTGWHKQSAYFTVSCGYSGDSFRRCFCKFNPKFDLYAFSDGRGFPARRLQSRETRGENLHQHVDDFFRAGAVRVAVRIVLRDIQPQEIFMFGKFVK